MKKTIIGLACWALALSPAFAGGYQLNNVGSLPAADQAKIGVLDVNGNLPLAATPLLNNQLPLLTTAQTTVVSEGGFFPDTTIAQPAVMFRWPQVMRASVTSGKLAFVIPNSWVNIGASGAEQATGGTLTCTGSLEYPAGVFQQMTTANGGSTSITVASGTMGVSDSFANPPPNGATFWTRLYCTSSNSTMPARSFRGTPAGAGVVFPSPTDQTLSGTVTNAFPYTGNAQVTATPFAPIVIGQTKARVFCEYGDSRTDGATDDFDGAAIVGGMLERSIGAYAPTLNLAVYGDRQAWFNASHTNRLALALAYCTDHVNAYGINDLGSGAYSAAQLESAFTTFLGYFPAGTKVSIATVPPYTGVPNVSVTTLAYSSLIETITLPNSGSTNYMPTSNYFLGEWLTISGATPASENGNCQVQTIVSITQFTCANPTSTGTGTATGTISLTSLWQDPPTQTPALSNESARTGFNDWCRTSSAAAGFYRCPDLSAQVESGYDSGLFGVYSAYGQKIPMTQDGLHMSYIGYEKILKSGVLSAAALY